MSGYVQQLREALQATTIHSPSSYSWFGRRSLRLPADLIRTQTPHNTRNFLLYGLSSRLYTHFYLCGIASPMRFEDDYPQETGPSSFVAKLSVANSGTGSWEGGWRIHAVETSDTISVTRQGLMVWASSRECSVAEKSPIGPGTAVRLRFPKELLGISGGFYVALGNKAPSLDDRKDLLRIYWNLTAEGAAQFVRIVTTALNGGNIPFRLKVLRDPYLFTRCDAGVLYFPRSDFRIASAILRKVHAQTIGLLKPAIPAFTKTLAYGVGLAENPDSGESFGQNRCRLVADAAIRAYEQGKRSVEDQLQCVSEVFSENGINLTAPYLNGGSKDDYERWWFPPRLTAIRSATKPPRESISSEALLRTADELGWRLVREAVWHRDQCNWIGAEATSRRGGGVGSPYSALRSDLYAGTSGIALFLAELSAATGAADTRRTAIGAVHQALARCDPMFAQSRMGFYIGALGIVFSAARTGIILGEQELVEQATRLLQECKHKWPAQREYDLLSGDAGAIVALLVLRELIDDPCLLDVARRLGDGLLRSADRSRGGSYSWRSNKPRYRNNLTGLSHGAAGAGYALLELFHVTGETQYLAAAQGAFEYERSWFNAEKGNWPDLREAGIRRSRLAPLSFSTFWCHGAPGIGLTRLRAYEILNEASSKSEARTATNTTYHMVKSAIRNGNVNYSLCHGLAGNAEVLIYAHKVLGEQWAQKSKLAFAVAEAGVDEFGKKNEAWSSSANQGKTPGLLTGLAGIGYFYLRLRNPEIPSILLLRREDFCSARS